MHYATHISHRMQKLKFGVTRPSALFMETAPGAPDHEKYCVNVSRPRCTGMHKVARRSCWMQKHMFSVTCPSALCVETASDPPEHEK
jgi:hypothetical protein